MPMRRSGDGPERRPGNLCLGNEERVSFLDGLASR